MSGQDMVRLMLGGDVMLGRGIDQVLPHPSPPRLHEWHVHSALDYVALAEHANGPISRDVPFAYVWGDALTAIERRGPDLRIVNLETAVTRSEDATPKGINYRMSPANLPCLTAARIDACTLANNHVLDWGQEGLLETLATLEEAGIAFAGAGRTREEAHAPAILQAGTRDRILVYGVACSSSGVPSDWEAQARRPGIALIADPSVEAADRLSVRIATDRQPDDIVVLSIHWGSNWGYDVSRAERAFAERLIERGQVDVVHGHSSHHFKAIEVFRNRPILYGCGDLINDYEGIAGFETFRSDLVLIYLLDISKADRRLVALDMLPFRIGGFRLNQTSRSDADWIRRKIGSECRAFGGSVTLEDDDSLSLAWVA